MSLLGCQANSFRIKLLHVLTELNDLFAGDSRMGGAMSTTIEMDSLEELIPQAIKSRVKRRRNSKAKVDRKNKGDNKIK